MRRRFQSRLGVDIRDSHSQMSVNARRLAAKQQAEERQQLLSGRAGAGDRDRGSRQRHGDPDAASMVRDAKDVTGTLKRARQMMSSQIDQLMNVTDLLGATQVAAPVRAVC